VSSRGIDSPTNGNQVIAVSIRSTPGVHSHVRELKRAHEVRTDEVPAGVSFVKTLVHRRGRCQQERT
jgi:hypothetical protein